MKRTSREKSHKTFRVHHYLLFASVLLLSFLGSYLLFSSQKAIAPAPPPEQLKQQAPPRSPQLNSSVVLAGLANPWDVAFLPNKLMLITERNGIVSRIDNGKKIELFKPDDVVARGEGGMLGLTVDPAFNKNHYIYTCFNSNKSGGLDIRVVRWEIKADGSGLVGRKGDIVTGMPANPSGRHSGCRIAFGPDDKLWIGTGDAAQSDPPQNMQSLGGKILRVDRDGQPALDNGVGDGADQLIYSWGHRNTQGLAFYSELIDGSYGVSAEHGPGTDDEVNPLKKGNFGWAPGPNYNESVPMTDLNRFPNAVKSIWSSGTPTLAISDAHFLKGSQWGSWEGRLVLATLKAKHLLLLEIKADGTVGEQLKLLNGEFGRLRSVIQGPDGALYISTDNSSDDKIIRLQAKTAN